MVSVLCRARSLFCVSQNCFTVSIVSMMSRVSPHFRLDSSPWRPRCSHHRRCTATLSSLAKYTNSLACLSVCLIQQYTRIPGLCLVHDESTSTRSWCSSAEHGFFVTVKTQASSRPSGHRAPCSAHSVFARISVRGSPNPQFLSKSITKIDGSCSSPGVDGCMTSRQAT